MTDTTVEPFREGSLLLGLDPALRAALFARGTAIALSEGRTLFMEGDESSGCYIVRNGGLKATRISADGDEQLLALFTAGDSIGEMAMFDDEPRSASIVALRDSSLLHWSRRAFFDFADENGTLYQHLLRMMALRLRETNDALSARDFLPLAGQLARVMLRLGRGFGTERADGSVRIDHRLTQAELASMIGASRENVSRVLNAWKREGILMRDAGHYVLLDTDGLEDLAEGGHPPS